MPAVAIVVKFLASLTSKNEGRKIIRRRRVRKERETKGGKCGEIEREGERDQRRMWPAGLFIVLFTFTGKIRREAGSLARN